MYSICAIIVTFNPNIKLLRQVIQRIFSQVDKILIIDNGSGQELLKELKSFFKLYSVHLISFKKNLGLAKAHNRGFQWAIEFKYSHVLLLDQDSIPSSNLIQNLLKAYIQLSNENKLISAVGPLYKNTYTNQYSYFVRFGLIGLKRFYCPKSYIDKYILTDFLISSGCLIPINAVLQIGMMDENLFIDHIDTEWFLRAKAKGYEAYGVCNALMLHSLGDKGIRLWFGRWLSIAQHKPERLYYDIRNSIIICKKNFISRKVARVIFLRELRLMLFYILFFPSRLTNIRYMVKGIKDGVQGKTGKIDKS